MFNLFKNNPELFLGMSAKSEGAMNIATAVTVQTLENRKIFFESQGLNVEDVVSAGLVHGSNARIVTEKDRGKLLFKTDALATNTPGIVLSITTADCFPVFFYYEENKTVGLVHAGWRGVVGGIVPKFINLLKKNFLVNPKNLLVGIGPGIRECHFEIKADILPQFSLNRKFILKKRDRIFVNLVGIIKQQLLEEEVPAINIEDVGECTFDFPQKYFSFRRDKPQAAQTMASFITLK